MAASPEWKVFNAAGEYKAACKDLEDAGVLAELYGTGAKIKNKFYGSKPLYTVALSIVGPDEIVRRVFQRIEADQKEQDRKRAARGLAPLHSAQ